MFLVIIVSSLSDEVLARWTISTVTVMLIACAKPIAFSKAHQATDP